ncbi:MAG: hypothetical protein II399_10010 [Lachnospiraceae bacterium]|nr:hypothetical protein [Lachnospiraceae bacterium]
MADLRKLMLDEIRKNPHIQSTYIDETEELIDTGLEKTEDNLNAVALAYLDEKGYRRISENVDITKKKILELSEEYDTLIVKKNKVVEMEIFEKASIEELKDALEVCLVNTASEIHSNLKRIADNIYDYKVDSVESIKLEKDRPKKTRLGEEEFESFEETLNRYAAQGYELYKVFPEPRGSKTILVFRKDMNP